MKLPSWSFLIRDLNRAPETLQSLVDCTGNKLAMETFINGNKAPGRAQSFGFDATAQPILKK